MKCQNCGKYEATCHYTSNINGKISEQHLCSECAAGAGWGETMFVDADRIFNNVFGGFGSFFGTPRYAIPTWGLGFRMPALLISRAAAETEDRAEPTIPQAEKTTQPDPEMMKRREINALREQMRISSEAEDFEKAAEIRDKLRGLEN